MFHPLCVCLVHLLVETPLLSCLLLGQLPVGLFLKKEGKAGRESGRGGGEKRGDEMKKREKQCEGGSTIIDI